MLSRRETLRNLAALFLASPLLRAQSSASGGGDAMLDLANVFDFVEYAQSKLDPVAWDYMDEGTSDEVAMRGRHSTALSSVRAS